jgi:thiamine pyrophosphate-dependent enzyme
VTALELLAACLAEAGVASVFGAPLAWLTAVPALEPALASLLADVDGRMGPGPGAALLPEQLLRISSRPGGSAEPVVVESAAEIPMAVSRAAARAAGPVPDTAALQLDFDLAAPAPTGLAPARLEPGPVLDPPALPEKGRVVVLAGPGVVRAAAVDALRDLAAVAGLGVVNTWGAKGIFDWRSDHHLGTAGLQERDFELCGFADVDLIVAAGLDPAESRRDRWALAPAVEVGPGELAVLADRAPSSSMPAIGRTELYGRLAAVVQPLYRSGDFPLSPGRAVADLAAGVAEGGFVAADPGPAGLWVGRAFPTSALGSVLVPATVAEGAATAAALVAKLRQPDRRVVAVTTAPLDDTTRALVAEAERLGAGLVVEAWGEEGELGGVDEHAEALALGLASERPTVLRVPVDWSHTDRLIDVAGPVVAWET